MAKQTKTTPASTSTVASTVASTSASTSTPTVVTDAVPSVVVKKTSVKKVKAEPEPVPVVVAVPEKTTVDTTVGVDSTVEETGDLVAELAAQSAEYLGHIQSAIHLLSNLKNEYRSLEKKWTREIKTAQKMKARRNKRAGSRLPSGIVSPTEISEELAVFLNKPLGEKFARTVITREINDYIKLHNLKDGNNGRVILPDAKLRGLLKLKDDEVLTYFNLQRYMSHHFASKDRPLVPSAQTA